MSGNAYYRFFPGDYLRDTIHLGWVEDCAYRRLIDLYQAHDGPIRNDRGYILRAVRASEPEQMTAVDTVLAEFFTLKADGWHQLRCDAEVTFRARARDHGTSAAKSRWEKLNKSKYSMHGQSPSNANQNQNHKNIVGDTKKRSRSAKTAATALPTDFELTDPMYEWAATLGLSETQIAAESEKWADHHRAKGNKFSDWTASWRNWMRNSVRYAKT